MKPSKTQRTASRAEMLWASLGRLLALDSSTGEAPPKEAPPVMKPVSMEWSQEVLGEWLWLHTPHTTWNVR